MHPSVTSGPQPVRSRVSESGGLLLMQDDSLLYRLTSLYFDRLSHAHTLIDLLMFAPSVGGRGSENLAPIAIAHLWALQIPRWGCLKHICDGNELLF